MIKKGDTVTLHCDCDHCKEDGYIGIKATVIRVNEHDSDVQIEGEHSFKTFRVEHLRPWTKPLPEELFTL